MKKQKALRNNYEKFWKRVDIKGADDCWEWMGYKCNKGYGIIGWERKVHKAHRVALLSVSNPSAEMHALHSCDNPSCCNPKHLRWGTNAENMMDRNKRNLEWRKNVAKSFIKSGQRRRVLKDSQVAYIKMLLQHGISAKECIECYGVGPSVIYQIKHNTSYRDIAAWDINNKGQ